MRRAALSLACAALLAGPTVLAFFSGGYFAGARVWAGAGAWACVAVAVAAGRRLPRAPASLIAIVALTGLAAWTLLSMLWAPVRGAAYGAGQIDVLYLGGLLAAALLLGAGDATRSRRCVEPALAAGILIVIGYGLSNRLLPGLLHFARSVSAEGRLEQPLTYWNAMGELAALGVVLVVRVAGDRTRAAALRILAAAAAVPLVVGLYISFSRGALFAAVAGLIAVTVLVPRCEQLSATLRAVLLGAVACAACGGLHGFTGLQGSIAHRERQGAIVFALLVVLAVAAAAGQWWELRCDRSGPLALPRRAPALATAVICVGLALAIAVGAHESAGPPPRLAGGAARLSSLQSDRFDYWSVALRAFAIEPLHGVGAGGWSVYWLRWRTIPDGAQDAHSLELQTLAELGIVGALLLLALLGAVTVAARRVMRDPDAVGGSVAGAVAALVAYLAHSPLDWDWQMPAVTLVAVILAGAVLATGGSEPAGATTAAAPDPGVASS